jgi:putative tributyrin esterase
MLSHSKKLTVFPLLLCIFLLLGSCHAVEQILPDKPQITSGVAMQDVAFRSAALGREMPYRVFFPGSIPAGQKLPVVYLLHGNGGSFRNWSDYSNASQYAAQGLILVMAEGNSSYFMNAVEKADDKYEDYFMQDLIGDVESRFPAKPGRANRAIVGVSMGGFAAVTLALRHPDMFVFAGAISPAIDVPERKFTWRRASQWLGFRSIFGPWGSAERDARDPFVLLRSAKAESTPYIYLTAGEQEPLREPIERFATRLQARGVAYELHTKPGGHDWAEWDEQIPGCFAKLFAALGKGWPAADWRVTGRLFQLPSGAERH